ncbi:hypothetical protein P7K49_002773, partial [Saguinus oedipus]
ASKTTETPFAGGPLVPVRRKWTLRPSSPVCWFIGTACGFQESALCEEETIVEEKMPLLFSWCLAQKEWSPLSFQMAFPRIWVTVTLQPLSMCDSELCPHLPAAEAAIVM